MFILRVMLCLEPFQNEAEHKRKPSDGAVSGRPNLQMQCRHVPPIHTELEYLVPKRMGSNLQNPIQK